MFNLRLLTHAHGNGRLRELPHWPVSTILVAAILALHTPESAPAPPRAGDLDPAFNAGGTVTTDFAGAGDAAAGVAIQPDGRIVVAGGSGTDFGLIRYRPDGTLDQDFGTDGRVSTDFAAGIDTAQAIALQPDGKIIAAGTAYEAGNDNFAVARYLPDGSLDTSFDTDGKVSTDFTGGADGANSVAIQPDGKIIAAGAASVGTGADFGVTRYHANGSLDRTFGSGGRVSTDIRTAFSEAFGVSIQRDGKIVAVGQVSVGSSDVALVRYLRNGLLDSRFGSGGIVTTDLGSFEQARAVALQPDGRIVVAGLTFTPGVDFAIARYLIDGALDPGFADGGTARTDFAGSNDEALAVAIQRDGKIVAAGVAGSGAAHLDFGVARYLPNGAPDAGFGGHGKVTTDIGGDIDTANAVAIQPNGKIVAAGRAVVAGSSDVAMARYQAGRGCPGTQDTP